MGIFIFLTRKWEYISLTEMFSTDKLKLTVVTGVGMEPQKI